MSEPRSSLSVTYYDPEAIPVPETPTPAPEEVPQPGVPTMNLLESDSPTLTPKKRGRPPGSKNKNKRKKKRKKRDVPWFTIWRVAFWGAISVLVVGSLYLGVQGWLGQSAAYLTLAVSATITAFLSDREWQKIRSRQ